MPVNTKAGVIIINKTYALSLSKYELKSGFVKIMVRVIIKHKTIEIIRALVTQPLLFLGFSLWFVIVLLETASGKPELSTVANTINTDKTIE